ncbi:MAG: hypothetical protein FGM32_09960 [Candidatus Kapabacteria bacterium]|nr:hypothetical protein [Candidatus Kapabacteria bacterium]
MNENQIAVLQMLHLAGFVTNESSIPHPCEFRWCVVAWVEEPDGDLRRVRVSIGNESVIGWLTYGDLYQLPDGAIAEYPDSLEQMRARQAAEFDSQEEIINKVLVQWENQVGEVEWCTEVVREWLKTRRAQTRSGTA